MLGARSAADALVKTFGLPKITNLVARTSVQHDLLVGMYATIFIGNSASTFSGLIAYTRYALGRDKETNHGTSEITGLRMATTGSEPNRGLDEYNRWDAMFM